MRTLCVLYQVLYFFSFWEKQKQKQVIVFAISSCILIYNCAGWHFRYKPRCTTIVPFEFSILIAISNLLYCFGRGGSTLARSLPSKLCLQQVLLC